MKYLLILLALTSCALILMGIYFDSVGDPISHKLYGSGTVLLFLVTMPLFLYWRRNKTSLKKYMLKKKEDEE